MCDLISFHLKDESKTLTFECVSVYLFNLQCGGKRPLREREHFIEPMSKLLTKHINYLFIF